MTSQTLEMQIRYEAQKEIELKGASH